MNPMTILLGLVGLFVFVSLVRSVRIVPGRAALVVERLGRYSGTKEAGFHVLVPFLDQVRYRHSLKEQAVDVPSQPCVTQDNVKVEVDGVLYFRVIDPKRASYGITEYKHATIQLAQTSMRSVIGKLELDRTFEEREQINAAIVAVLDDACEPWGVKVTRYEIQNINVPDTVLESMQYQLRAERERRAVIARSEGDMESRINYSEAQMQEAVNKGEGEKERRINEAQGQAAEITALATATTQGLRLIAEAIEEGGGEDALVLQLAENYIAELDKLATSGTRMIVPMDVTDVAGAVRMIRRVLEVPGGSAEDRP